MNIKTGDLVMVVKPTPCCRNASEIGRMFAVTEIINADQRFGCEFCGDDTPELVAGGYNNDFLEVERLKKIDPPADGDSLPTRKDLEVTA